MKRLLPVLMGFALLLLSSTEGWARIRVVPVPDGPLPPCPGSPTSKYKETKTWTDCAGTITYLLGDKYVGQWKNGERHGQGTTTYANGDKYVGEFRIGEYHGHGTTTYAKSGYKYVGGWWFGKRHGQGTETFPYGLVRKGLWTNGKFLYAKKPSPAVIAKKTVPKPVPKVAKRPDDIAVIIANSDYKKLGKGIPNVKPAYTDANNIKRYFIKSLGVREGNIIYLKDATGTQMTSVFGSNNDHRGKLFNWTKPNVSKVYVYYAGHGAPAGDRGTTYLVPSDADSETVQLTGYPLKQLYKNLGKVPATSITVILEACFSGQSQSGYFSSKISGIRVVPRMPPTPRKITVISAGAANQVATWEEDESQSLFTKYFLKGMSGEGDNKPYGNSDGKVSLRELKKYLDGNMTYYARRYYGRTQQAQIVVNGKELSPTN